jgi:DNA (cytosine-5)-methyltransferase 1
MALKNLGVNFEHVGIMEVDKYAILSYDAIHNEDSVDFSSNLTKEQMIAEMRKINIAYNFSTYVDEMPSSEEDVRRLYNAVKRTNNFGDITKVNTKDLPDFDFFTYSFPCKNISIAGNQVGMDKDSGSQSSLVWECERIIRDKKPRYLMMENVKNICGKKHIAFFESWIKLLSDMGYESHWDVYNAKDYGVSQSRERVIMMSEYKGDAPRTRTVAVQQDLW